MRRKTTYLLTILMLIQSVGVFGVEQINETNITAFSAENTIADEEGIEIGDETVGTDELGDTINDSLEEIVQEAIEEFEEVSEVPEENIDVLIEQIAPIKGPLHTKIALESYHKRQYEQIFEFLPKNASENITRLAKLEKQIQQIEKFLGRVESASDFVSGKKEEITGTIENFSKLVEEAEGDLEDTNKAIKALNGAIERNLARIIHTTREIDSLEEKLKKNREILTTYVSYLSASGDVLYTDTGKIDIVRSVILTGEDSGTVLNDQYLDELLTLTGYALVEENDLLLNDLSLKKEELQKSRKNQKRQEARLERYKNTLSVQRAHKNKILGFAQKQDILLSGNLEKIQRDKRKLSNNLLNHLRNYELELKNVHETTGCSETVQIGECEQVKKYFELEKQLIRIQGKNKVDLIWPAKPINGISAYYHDRGYHEQFGTFHKAIDLPLEQGTGLMSPENGYILAITEPKEGNYGMVAIKHAGGYVSVHGHVTEVLFDRFDMIEKGQIFAKSGGEPNTPGAGNITTGPHLHFELYKDAVDVDPLEHINITQIRPEKIDKLYGFKYLEDTYDRYGDDVETRRLRSIIDIFRIEGGNELDKQRSFLRTYAHPDFASPDPWIQAGVDHGIDPSFLMCIGFSESTLGNYLKSRYNIGNVGNNDSGDVVLFGSAYQGISAIANVLNNQYLGDYTILRDLSGWGDHPGLKYATSPQNWHRNNVQCVSALKEKYIGHNYEFRIPITTKEAYEEEIRLNS